ncbi:hypothetical protein EYF80_035558 [Liparis tanakae]|uniref:Uncharacterized protein n=1 Tax=Liparis tanakae TaxID=230148 RepID=A0A4Z2GKX8_9TELE|nr:hypothetical protein EYF80_035558 [Liparis tanakae]
MAMMVLGTAHAVAFTWRGEKQDVTLQAVKKTPPERRLLNEEVSPSTFDPHTILIRHATDSFSTAIIAEISVLTAWSSCHTHTCNVDTQPVSLPVLYVRDDFVRLLAHRPHVQLGLVAVTFADVLVQAAPGSVRQALRDVHACPLPRAASGRRL